MCVYACVCIRQRGRETFYIYECVRQRYKSSAGLLRRGEPHQKCHSSAICYWLKLCNCNSVASAHTTRSMLNKFTCTHTYTDRTVAHMQTHKDKCRLYENGREKKEYLALRESGACLTRKRCIHEFILVTGINPFFC